jgi:hypothetical protein
MKYWILKIIGIAGLVITAFCSDYFINEFLSDEYTSRSSFLFIELYGLLLILFLVITIAGFSRTIARIKAIIDFYTDFDDDPDLDGYPKLRIYKIFRLVMLFVIAAFVIVSLILTNSVSFFKENIYYIVASSICFVFALSFLNIIMCLIARVVPLNFDIAIIFSLIAVVLYFMLPYWGCNDKISKLILAPIIALALLHFAFSNDDYFLADFIYDDLIRDEYDSYYKKLCDKEKMKKENK